jgi:ArsR family transcriptional regulator, lead/cadmium/zinc/bismuth-responsive transcriptional repressor
VSYEELMVFAQTLPPEAEPPAPKPKPPTKSFLDLPDDDYADPEDPALLFKALGNEMRMEIIQFLEAHPATITDIALMLEIPSHYLNRPMRILKQAGIVTMKRDGKSKIYSLRGGVTPMLTQAARLLKP